ncbi:MAG TPA: acylphosphatase, partial [Aestuariivirga sp.]|nr:acylphosphatase [Aestuariivirga sp.]
MGAHIIKISGTVQGVGFRPTVWRVAGAMGRRGHVLNDGAGVTILVDGDVAEFVAALRENAPPLSRIEGMTIEPSAAAMPESFEIVASRASVAETGIAADAATCPACLAEILDARERRARYAFTNCTHCGPRWTIIKAVPYDRANTSMA